MIESQKPELHPWVRRVIFAGWGCVALSALFLYLSSGKAEAPTGSSEAMLWAVYLMLARLFGLGSFAIGGIAIFNHRWTMGVVLFLLSVLLPFLAYTMYGTI